MKAKEEEAEETPQVDAPRPTKRRRYTLPIPLDDTTGEVLDTATRKSSRKATVQSKRELHTKLKDEQVRRVRLSTFTRLARILHSRLVLTR